MLTGCRLRCVQDTVTKQVDYVELGLAYVDVCIAPDRGLDEELESP